MKISIIEIYLHAYVTNARLQKHCQVGVARLVNYTTANVIELISFSLGYLKTFAKPAVQQNSSGKIIWT